MIQINFLQNTNRLTGKENNLRSSEMKGTGGER